VCLQWDNFAYASKAREIARLAALDEKKNTDTSLNDETKAKRKIRAEMRVAWSEQQERQRSRDERKTKKDKRKQAEWEAKQAEGSEEMGRVAAFRLAKKKLEEDGDEEMNADYRVMKREIKEERSANMAKREHEGGDVLPSGMFGDME